MAFAIIFFIICIIVLLILFLLKFHNQEVSNNIAEWGSFGSFLAGILALLSLIIISYITYQVSKNTIEENKNLFLYKKRLEAYDELLIYVQTYMYHVIMLRRKISWTTQFIESSVNNEIKLGVIDIEDRIEKLFEQLDYFTKLYHYLDVFHARYIHLFENLKKNEIYNNLVSSSSRIQNELELFGEDLMMMKIKTDTDFEQMVDNFKLLIDFANVLNDRI